jgi:hypothetical protein
MTSRPRLEGAALAGLPSREGKNNEYSQYAYTRDNWYPTTTAMNTLIY